MMSSRQLEKRYEEYSLHTVRTASLEAFLNTINEKIVKLLI